MNEDIEKRLRNLEKLHYYGIFVTLGIAIVFLLNKK